VVCPDISVALWPVAIAAIFLVGLYGGYFGSGIGILMIGALSFISRGISGTWSHSKIS
jgi:hypothetical protein